MLSLRETSCMCDTHCAIKAKGAQSVKAQLIPIAETMVTATVTVPIITDEVKEPDERFLLLLTNPVQAILSNNQIEGIIHDLFNPSDPDNYRIFLPGLGGG